MGQGDAVEPVVVELGEKRARKLAAFHYAADGAKAVASAALAQHKALHQKWQDAVNEALEDAGVEATGTVRHDVDAGTITVGPGPAAPPPNGHALASVPAATD